MRRLLVALLVIALASVYAHVDAARADQPPVGAGYWFTHPNGNNGGPVKWRCPYPLEVQINWQGFSDNQRLLIRSAFEHATDHSGHAVDFQGRTFDEPNQAEPGRIVVRERPFNDPPQPDSVTGWTDPDPPIVDGTYRGGLILLNRNHDWFATGYFKATIWHEVGHVLGLDHYIAQGNTMHPNNTQEFYDADTRAGLRAVGGC